MTGFALLVSILIWYAGRGAGLYRSVFILTMTISLTAAGVIWSFIYNPDPSIGLLNALIVAVGRQKNEEVSGTFSQLENVWSNKKPSKEALDNAVQRGNAVMQPQPVAAKAKGKSKSSK